MRKIMTAALLILLISGCKAKSPSYEKKTSSDSAPAPAAEISDEKSKQEKLLSEEPSSSDQSLLSWFSEEGDIEKQRLLEYTVELSYETRNFSQSREYLLSIIKKYGFIRSSYIDKDDGLYLVTDFSIRKDFLYTVLQQLNNLGSLEEEQISSIDHTLENVYNLIKKRREQLRIERRLQSLTGSYATKQNYEQRELFLSGSEDALDENEYRMKQLDDAVQWVKINVSVKQKKDTLFQVPDFTDAFVMMINIFLRTIYILIILLPYIVIVILLLFLRKPITNLIKKTAGRKKQ